MKRYKGLALVFALILILSACGASGAANKRSGYSEPEDIYTSDSYYEGKNSATRSPSMISASDESSSYAPMDTESPASDIITESVTRRDNTKVIYIANASLETTEFENTCAALRQLTKQLGGYMESEDITNSSSTGSSSRRRASFTVRVPAESYEDFISGMGEGCKVISIMQSKEDVGAEYFDVEQKLETLNNKRDRLEALLEKADNMENIIQLENALSDTEYEINHYKSTLNRYDSLISFSTVNISLKEVSLPGEGIDEDPGFFARLARNFSEGFEGFTDALENLAYWFSYNLLTIIVIVVIIVVIVKIHPIRRIKKAAGKKSEKSEENRQ